MEPVVHKPCGTPVLFKRGGAAADGTLWCPTCKAAVDKSETTAKGSLCLA